MRSDLPQLASRIGTAERTLRRAVEEGLVRAERPGPRRIVISEDERAYLRSHWVLLSRLRRALRTEPNVRFAMLFGSAARGDDHDGSDIDVFVLLRDDHVFRAADVAERLSRAVGREIDVVRLSQAQRQPALMVRILDEGRVLVDRAGATASLRHRRDDLSRQAAAHRARSSARARAVLEGISAA